MTVSALNKRDFFLKQKPPSTAKLLSDCGDRVVVIDCSCSVNQGRPGVWHRSWIFFVVMQSGPEYRKLVAPTAISRTLFISFNRLPSRPLGSRAERMWRLRANQMSEVFTRPWDKTAQNWLVENKISIWDVFVVMVQRGLEE